MDEKIGDGIVEIWRDWTGMTDMSRCGYQML